MKDLGEGKESVYKTLDEAKRPIWFRITPKPFISSIADENEKLITELGDELLSRVTLIRTDSTVDLNIKVIESKLERAQNPYLKKKEEILKQFKDYQSYVRGLPDITKYTFIYPMGKTMKTAIPPLFTDSRRDCDRYLDNTYGITLFHKYDRIQFIKNGKLNLVVTPADVWYNDIIYGDLLIQSALKCSHTEKIILDILVMYHEKYPDEGGMKLKDLHKSLMDNNLTPTMGSIRKYCLNLYKNGYIIINEDKTYEPTAFFKNKEYKVRIDWNAVIEESKKSIKENFPQIADEYIKRFCNSGIHVIHPFTGEIIDITKYKEADNMIVMKRDSLSLWDWGVKKDNKQESVLPAEIFDFSELKREGKIPKETEILEERFIDYFERHKTKKRIGNVDMLVIDAQECSNVFDDDKINNLKKKSILYEPSPGFYGLL